MGATAPAKRTTRAAAKKATGRVIEAAPGSVRQVMDERDLPPELRDMYTAPKLTRARGAGTTGTDDGGALDFDTTAPAPEIPMERLFSIDGQPFYIPTSFPPGYAIIYMDSLAEEGRDVATAKVLKLAIGEGWKALRDLCEERPDLITPGQFKILLNKVFVKVMGTVEEAGEGN